ARKNFGSKLGTTLYRLGAASKEIHRQVKGQKSVKFLVQMAAKLIERIN
ncbi:4604_t:CDS:1, partial [Ambispora gerdemannii]